MIDKNLDPTIVHAAIDGELEPQEHAATLDAISADPAASALYAEYRRLKFAVSALPQADVPKGAWRSCTRRLDEIDRNRRAERFVTRYAWAMSAGVFLLIVGAGSWNRLTGQHLNPGDVAHMASVLSPFDRTQRPDTATVGKWLQDRVGTSNITLPRPPLSAEYGQAGETRLARLVLADPYGEMVLYVWRGTDPLDGFEPVAGTGLSAGSVLNQNAVEWMRDGCHFVLVGPRDINGLARAAASLSQSSGPGF